MEWTKEQQQALNWAIKQSFPSVAATYAKILAEMIIQLETENESLLEHQRAFEATKKLSAKTVEIIITWIKATALPYMTGQPMIDKLQAYSKALGGEGIKGASPDC